jgi:PKHD-type hydroxylase
MQNDRIFQMPHMAMPEFASSSWSTTANFLSSAQCQDIIDYGNAQDIDWAGVYNSRGSEADELTQEEDLSHRRVLSCALPEQDFPWLYTKLAAEAQVINELFYDFDIRGCFEDVQWLKYENFEDVGPGKFDWHLDTAGSGIRNRKISMIIQLSKPGDYDGGELQFAENARFMGCDEKEQGSLITFASNRCHRITPLVRGTRYSLVLWITGPPFR